MPPRESRFEIGRINILPILPEAEHDSFLWQGLATDVADEYYGSLWKFLDVERLEVAGHPYITGYLVKYEPEGQEEVVDSTETHITTETIERPIRAKSRFAIHAPSLIIAYHPIVPEINRRLFADRFARLFQLARQNFFVDLQLQSIQPPEALVEAMKRFDFISQVRVVLHPSNPGMGKWKYVDDHIRKVGAARYEETYKAKVEGGAGLKPVGDEEIETKIAMAEDGYGEAKVTGVQEGRFKTISTATSAITATAPRDGTADAKTVVEQLHEVIARLLERFR